MVVIRIDDHGHRREILGGRAQHGRAADVDILECVLQGHSGLTDGGDKRVEIYSDQVYGPDAMFGQFSHLFR